MLLDLLGEKTATPSGDQLTANSLAIAIAQLSDQGTGKGKRVAPEVLAAREAAHERMLALIAEARENGEKPIYKLINKVYLDEVLVDPIWVGSDHVQRPTEIGWRGIPNQAMRPVNDAAKRIFGAFNESIGGAMGNEAPLRVTAGGLVVMRRQNGAMQEALHVGNQRGSAPEYGEGLRLHGRGMPGAIVETRVLGTLAQPARQMA